MRADRSPLLFVLALTFLAAGCGNGEGGGGTGTVAPEARDPLPVPDANFPEAVPTPSVPPAGFPRPCGDLYDPETLPVFEIEMDPPTWNRMQEEYLQYIENWYGPVTFRYGDEVRTDVMIRNRGNWSRCGEKSQIAIDFNEIDEDARFHGVRRIDLDHGGSGCRTLEERTAMTWLREDLGLPAQCSNHAELWVNGQYYGLFGNLEHQDREFLERNFPDPDGNLYKSGRDKTTNEADPDDSDLDAFWDANTPEELDAIADLDQMLLGWAAEAMIPAKDNFWIWGWNYYLYNDPDRGWVFIPNDFDQAHPTASTIRFSPLPAREPPATWLLDHESWEGRFLDAMQTVHSKLDTDLFAERIDEYWEQIGPSAHADSFLGWNPSSDRYAGLKSRYRARHEFMGDWLVCARDPHLAADDDGDGWVWCKDCKDSDGSVHPGGDDVCGDGVDSDCDGVADDGCPPPSPTPEPTATPPPPIDPPL